MKIRLSAVLVAILYVILNIVDLQFTQKAMSVGVTEGNPFLAVAFSNGHGHQLKIAVAVLAAIVMMIGYRQRIFRIIAWSGVVLMTALAIYHLWGLSILPESS